MPNIGLSYTTTATNNTSRAPIIKLYFNLSLAGFVTTTCHNALTLQSQKTLSAEYQSSLVMVENNYTTEHYGFSQQQSNDNTSNFGVVSGFAKSLFSSENVASVSQVVGEKVNELKRQAEDGDNSLRLLALLGGIILIVVASMEFAGRIMLFEIVDALIELYSFCVGIFIIVIESKNMLLSEGLQVRIFKYALFLKFLWGRGVLYFIVGTLQLYKMDIWNLLAGGYLCAVGALMVFVGHRTACKLKNMRKSLYSKHELQAKFAQHDMDGDGGLNVQQFRSLTVSLGLDMTRRETEAAFTYMKKTSSEKLSYEEFHSWWNHAEMEDDIDGNAFSFV